jgi:hypothetical protein
VDARRRLEEVFIDGSSQHMGLVALSLRKSIGQVGKDDIGEGGVVDGSS